ncbi:MAG: hypothetical protein WBA17_17170 [Saprospiraceae bacterium]
MAAKKKAPTSKVSDAFAPKRRPTAKEAAAAAAQITGTPEDGRGRPKATHNLKRTSVLVDPDQMQQLKIQAVKESRHMYELLGEAIDHYLTKG